MTSDPANSPRPRFPRADRVRRPRSACALRAGAAGSSSHGDGALPARGPAPSRLGCAGPARAGAAAAGRWRRGAGWRRRQGRLHGGRGGGRWRTAPSPEPLAGCGGGCGRGPPSFCLAEAGGKSWQSWPRKRRGPSGSPGSGAAGRGCPAWDPGNPSPETWEWIPREDPAPGHQWIPRHPVGHLGVDPRRDRAPAAWGPPGSLARQ